MNTRKGINPDTVAPFVVVGEHHKRGQPLGKVNKGGEEGRGDLDGGAR